MLLMDGVKYELREPSDEKELENMVLEHHQEIFGSKCLYFDIKHKLKGNSVAAIPDALAVTFNPDRWWIVEVELSSHPVYEHIQNQVGKFVAALPKSDTRHEVINVLWQEIKADEIVRYSLQNEKGGEIFKWLSDVVNQQPQIVIIMDKSAPELEDALAALNIRPRVIIFETYVRDPLCLAVHEHRFEPIIQHIKTPANPIKRQNPSGPQPPAIDSQQIDFPIPVSWKYKGKIYGAQLLKGWKIQLDDKPSEGPYSPSRAATEISGNAEDGWFRWCYLDKSTGKQEKIDRLRKSNV